MIWNQGRSRLIVGILFSAVVLCGCGSRELRSYQGAMGEPKSVAVLKAGGKWPRPGLSASDFNKTAGLISSIKSPPIGGSLMGGGLEVLSNLAQRKEYSGSFMLLFIPRSENGIEKDVTQEALELVRSAIEEELVNVKRSLTIYEPAIPYGILEYRIVDGECDWQTWFCMVRVQSHQEPAAGYMPPHSGNKPAWIVFMPITNGMGNSSASMRKPAFPDASFWKGVSQKLPDWSYIYLQPYMASVFENDRYRFLETPIMLNSGEVLE